MPAACRKSRSMMRARSTRRARRLVSTPRKTPMPDNRNTGASASWIAWAMSTTSRPCTAHPRSTGRASILEQLQRLAAPRTMPALMSGAGFKDHFSRLAAAYSRYRPAYPPELIEFVAGCAPDRRCAVDCATGSGQAAVALASTSRRWSRSTAARASLRNAQPHPRRPLCRVRWRSVCRSRITACRCAGPRRRPCTGSTSSRFYAECRRVLRAGRRRGRVDVREIPRDPSRRRGDGRSSIAHVIGPYWPPERRYVDEGYRTIPFPWHELAGTTFHAAHGLDPRPGARLRRHLVVRAALPGRARRRRPTARRSHAELATAWRADGTLRLQWPIHLRLGRA